MSLLNSLRVSREDQTGWIVISRIPGQNPTSLRCYEPCTKEFCDRRMLGSASGTLSLTGSQCPAGWHWTPSCPTFSPPPSPTSTSPPASTTSATSPSLACCTSVSTTVESEFWTWCSSHTLGRRTGLFSQAGYTRSCFSRTGVINITHHLTGVPASLSMMNMDGSCFILQSVQWWPPPHHWFQCLWFKNVCFISSLSYGKGMILQKSYLYPSA